jgi:hypothetical protein
LRNWWNKSFEKEVWAALNTHNKADINNLSRLLPSRYCFNLQKKK